MKRSAKKLPAVGQAKYGISVPAGPLAFQVQAAVRDLHQVLSANGQELEPGRLGLELVWQERSRDGGRFLVFRETSWSTQGHPRKEK